MEVTGRDGVLESIHEIRSLEVNCRAEVVGRFMDRRLLQVWRRAAWKRPSVGGLFCRPWALTRDGLRFGAEAGTGCLCDRVSESVSKGSIGPERTVTLDWIRHGAITLWRALRPPSTSKGEPIGNPPPHLCCFVPSEIEGATCTCTIE